MNPQLTITKPSKSPHVPTMILFRAATGRVGSKTPIKNMFVIIAFS